ncbi:MAG: hypothetical protein ACMUIU_17485 [bacterium]
MKFYVTKFFVSVLILAFVVLSIKVIHAYAECLDGQCLNGTYEYGFPLDSESQASSNLSVNLGPQTSNSLPTISFGCTFECYMDWVECMTGPLDQSTVYCNERLKWCLIWCHIGHPYPGTTILW